MYGLLVALVGLGGCGGATPEDPDPPSPVLDPVAMPGETASPEGPTCERVDGALAPGATLEDRAGTFRLTLVRGDVDVRPSWVEGELILVRRSTDLRELDGWTTPLQGTADIEIEHVGAYEAGSLTNEDPAAPGVLVLEDDSDEPTIILRLGSSANRTDRTAFDQAFTALTVQLVDDDGFAGSWRSGLFGDEVSGYFCAVAEDG